MGERKLTADEIMGISKIKEVSRILPAFMKEGDEDFGDDEDNEYTTFVVHLLSGVVVKVTAISYENDGCKMIDFTIEDEDEEEEVIASFNEDQVVMIYEFESEWVTKIE